MSAMVMNQQIPHRKPVGRPSASFTTQTPKQPPAQAQLNSERLHSRTRTNSSSVMPYGNTSPPSASPAYSMTSQQQQPQQPPYPAQQTRRTLSNATSSTSTSNNSNLQRAPTNTVYTTTDGVRRSTSSRSNSSISPTSYVALMRKQKATVWCDRAQNEDPRILAAQRQAKMRAAAEVAGGHGRPAQVRTSTSGAGVVGGVRSKIRHHGAPKASAYNAAVVGGAGVPMRLSASEVDDGNESDDETGAKYHVRNGSGRSSLGSGGRRSHTYLNSGLTHSYSNGSTPPNHSPVEDIEEKEEEPRERGNSIQGDDYFTQEGGTGESGKQEEDFGSVSNLPQARGKLSAEEQAKKLSADELRRRGSVDERTQTMSGVRLFIANPDTD